MSYRPPPGFCRAHMPLGLTAPWTTAPAAIYQAYAHLVGPGRGQPTKCLHTDDPGSAGRAAISTLPFFSPQRDAALMRQRSGQAQARASVVQALTGYRSWSLLVPISSPQALAVIAPSARTPGHVQASFFDDRGPWSHCEQPTVEAVLTVLHDEYAADLSVVPCWLVQSSVFQGRAPSRGRGVVAATG